MACLTALLTTVHLICICCHALMMLHRWARPVMVYTAHLPLRIAAQVAFMRFTCCAVNCVRQASSVYCICMQKHALSMSEYTLP